MSRGFLYFCSSRIVSSVFIVRISDAQAEDWLNSY